MMLQNMHNVKKMFVKTLSLLLLHGFVLVYINCTNYQLHDNVFIQVCFVFGHIQSLICKVDFWVVEFLFHGYIM